MHTEIKIKHVTFNVHCTSNIKLKVSFHITCYRYISYCILHIHFILHITCTFHITYHIEISYGVLHTHFKSHYIYLSYQIRIYISCYMTHFIFHNTCTFCIANYMYISYYKPHVHFIRHTT